MSAASKPRNPRLELRAGAAFAGSRGSRCSPGLFLGHRWSPERLPVLVIGDSVLDVYVDGTVERISPEAPVPVMRQGHTRLALGGAANVAANIVGLGGSAHLISCLGNDTEGDGVASMLGGAGVTSSLIKTGAKPTTVKTRFSAGQHQLLRLDKEDATSISRCGEEDVLVAFKEKVDHCRVVVVSDYGKGMLTDRVLREAIRVARSKGVPVIVDPKRRDLSVYSGATLIKPNRVELEAVTGAPLPNDIAVERAAVSVASAIGSGIVVTRSEAGMSLALPDGTAIHMSTHAIEVFDVAGAGDAVIAAMAVALGAGRSIEEAMAFGNIAGGIAVSKRGTAVVWEAEIEARRALIAKSPTGIVGNLTSSDEAVRLRHLWKSQGLTVGFTNGCFDLIHPGHVSLLQEAANACDRLIVGLNSDASVRRLKGTRRPVQSIEARSAVLAAVEHVDLVVAFDEDTPLGLIERLVPDVLVKGADYRAQDIVGANVVAASGGRVMTVELVPGQSTSRLIERSDAGVKSEGLSIE